MGCCTSKPCMPKWCGDCCCKKINNSTARNTNEHHNCHEGEGGVTIQMNELEEENEDEDSINEEVTFGVLLPEQCMSVSKQLPPRSNHNSNGNNDTNSERPDRKPSGNNKSKAPTHPNGSLHATPPLSRESTSNQYQFFKLLDEKIEMGPDYDANCERERKLECERINTLIRNWESCSRSSSQASTPQKRSTVLRSIAQTITAAKQPNAALEHATQSPQQLRHQQIISSGHSELPRAASHQLNRVDPHHLQPVQSSQQPSAIVTGVSTGRYWSPLEMGFNNFQEIYDFESPMQHQRSGAPAINQTATIIHQTYEVIGSHTPIPALLRTGVGNANPPTMSNQLFQFSRNSGSGSVAGSNSTREYHQEMYTGSHNATPFLTAASSRQQIAIFDQNGVPPKARCVLIPTPQPQRHLNPNNKYDTYSYRQTAGPNVSVSVAPPIPPICTSAQLKFSTLVSQGTPLQQKQQQLLQHSYGNGEVKLGKKLVMPKDPHVHRPSKEHLKHQQLVYGEVHQQPNQKGESSAPQQIQENQQQWQLQSNGLLPGAGPSGCSVVPGQPSSNARNFQSTVHIPMKAVVPDLRKSQSKVQKDHIEIKKMK